MFLLKISGVTGALILPQLLVNFGLLVPQHNACAKDSYHLRVLAEAMSPFGSPKLEEDLISVFLVGEAKVTPSG